MGKCKHIYYNLKSSHQCPWHDRPNVLQERTKHKNSWHTCLSRVTVWDTLSAGPLTRARASRPSETSRLRPHSPHSGFSATANPTISFLRKKLAGNFSSQPIKSLDVFLGTQAPVALAHKPLLCLSNGLSKAFRCPGGSPVQAPLLTSCLRDDAPGSVLGPALVLTMDMAPADDPGSGSRVGHQDAGERCPLTTALCSLSRSSSSRCPQTTLGTEIPSFPLFPKIKMYFWHIWTYNYPPPYLKILEAGDMVKERHLTFRQPSLVPYSAMYMVPLVPGMISQYRTRNKLWA